MVCLFNKIKIKKKWDLSQLRQTKKKFNCFKFALFMLISVIIEEKIYNIWTNLQVMLLLIEDILAYFVWYEFDCLNTNITVNS